MTKQEFLERYKAENLTIGEGYLLVLDEMTDEPYVLGCVYDQEEWKIYKTGERDGHYIIKTYSSESEAFDFFYELVLSKHKRK